MPDSIPSRPVPDRLRWWQEARFGVSFHWGLYSIPARGEWVRSAERRSLAAYQPWFDSFTADRYDARRWAALVRAGGARYGLLTTKHHDGFCLFDSALTDYTSMHTPARRDLVREYVEAFRAEGLRVGLYYSLVDWRHPDCPAYGDRQHPLRWDESQRGLEHRWERYVEYFHGQVRELLSNYGRIDLLCFDFSYWDYDSQAWRAEELVRMIRQLQPDIVLNDRLHPGCAIKRADPPAWAGDFDSPEQLVPDRGIRDVTGRAVPWESWITSNNSWCHNPLDLAWKSPADVIRTLVNCVSKGGNLSLNLGPTAPHAARFPPRANACCARSAPGWNATVHRSTAAATPACHARSGAATPAMADACMRTSPTRCSGTPRWRACVAGCAMAAC